MRKKGAISQQQRIKLRNVARLKQLGSKIELIRNHPQEYVRTGLVDFWGTMRDSAKDGLAFEKFLAEHGNAINAFNLHLTKAGHKTIKHSELRTFYLELRKKWKKEV